MRVGHAGRDGYCSGKKSQTLLDLRGELHRACPIRDRVKYRFRVRQLVLMGQVVERFAPREPLERGELAA